MGSKDKEPLKLIKKATVIERIFCEECEHSAIKQGSVTCNHPRNIVPNFWSKTGARSIAPGKKNLMGDCGDYKKKK